MKLRFTAFSISSMDMNTVMILRRNRNPATPSTNNTALSVRNQEIGTPVMLFQFLSRQNDGADNRDQDQDRSHFEDQQILREQGVADIASRAAGETAELHRSAGCSAGREHALYEISQQAEQG